MENRVRIWGVRVDLGPLGRLFRRSEGALSHQTISTDLGGYVLDTRVTRGLGKGTPTHIREQYHHQVLLRTVGDALVERTRLDLRGGHTDAQVTIDARGLPKARYSFRDGECHLTVDKGRGQEVVITPAQESGQKLVITV